MCFAERQMIMKRKRLLKALKRIFIIFVVIGLAVVIMITGINIYVRQSVKDRIISADEAEELGDVDCIIVLGASVRNGDTPSPMLEDRLNRGIELYFAGCSPKLLMSGDHGGMYYDEVNVMKNFAMSKGVPSSDIFMDHAGFSTYESMYRAKKIFGAKRVIIVTQEYHLVRALYIADKLGLDAYGVPTEDMGYSGQSARNIREVLAVTKDFFQVIFKPEATIMGSPVSLDGNGDVTNDRD